MKINAWNCLAQSQFVTFKIFMYKISKQKQLLVWCYGVKGSADWANRKKGKKKQ